MSYQEMSVMSVLGFILFLIIVAFVNKKDKTMFFLTLSLVISIKNRRDY